MKGLTGADGFEILKADALGHEQFEDWAGEEAERTGLWRYSRISRSGDGGADDRLMKVRKDIVLVQCKFTKKVDDRYLGASPLHEILHAKNRYPAENGQQCVVITNAPGYTKAAKDLAAREGVILIDRNNLPLWPNHPARSSCTDAFAPGCGGRIPFPRLQVLADLLSCG